MLFEEGQSLRSVSFGPIIVVVLRGVIVVVGVGVAVELSICRTSVPVAAETLGSDEVLLLAELLERKTPRLVPIATAAMMITAVVLR